MKKKVQAKKKKKKKNQYTYPDSNPQPPALELNALPTWPLHYIKFLKIIRLLKSICQKFSGGHFDVKKRLRKLKG